MKKKNFAAGMIAVLAAAASLVSCSKGLDSERLNLKGAPIGDTTVVVRPYVWPQPYIWVVRYFGGQPHDSLRRNVTSKEVVSFRHDTTMCKEVAHAASQHIQSAYKAGAEYTDGDVVYIDRTADLTTSFVVDNGGSNFSVVGNVVWNNIRSVKAYGRTLSVPKGDREVKVVFNNKFHQISQSSDENKKYYRYSYEYGFEGEKEGTHTALHTLAVNKGVVPTDQLIGTDSSDGLDYVDPKTNRSWKKTWEIWQRPDGSTYKKNEKEISVLIYNEIQNPAKVIKDVEDFVFTTERTFGPEYAIGTRTDKGILITKYGRKLTLKNQKYSQEWIFTYEKPEGMKYAEYTLPTWKTESSKVENSSSEVMNVVYNVASTFNEHPQSATGLAELRKKKSIIPHWMGEIVDIKYTLVQESENSPIKGMYAVRTTNGVALVPDEGVGGPSVVNPTKLDAKYLFAYSSTDAAKYGVEQCAREKDFSAQWNKNLSKWVPAGVRVVRGDNDDTWVYYSLLPLSHNVTRNDALKLGVGPDPHPVPKQSMKRNADGSYTLTVKRNMAKDSREITFVIF